MRKFSKLFAIMTMVALLLTSIMPVSIFAAGTGTITVNVPTGTDHTLAHTQFKLYKIFDLVFDETVGGDNGYNYNLATGFTTLTHTYGGTPYTGLQLEAYLQTINPNGIGQWSPALDAFAQTVYDFVNAAGFTGAPIAPTSATAATVEFTQLDPGYYLVVGAINANGDTDQVVYASCGLTSVKNAQDITVTPKADAPEINKYVKNENTPATDDDWTNWTDLNIDEDAEFLITSKVPNVRGYNGYTFIVRDTLSKGLDFNNNVVVTIEGIGELQQATGDTINPGDDYAVVLGTYGIPDTDPLYDPEYKDATTITIIFRTDLFDEDMADADIEITYSARVTEGAIVGVPGNPNKVKLQYSSDPNWIPSVEIPEEPTEETPEEEVKVYTFEIDIYKYYLEDRSDTTDKTPLAGAKFKLYTNRTWNSTDSIWEYSDTDAVKFNLDGDIAAVDNTYFRNATGTAEFESPADGTIFLKGLDAGKYYLVETSAPDTYNKLIGDFEVDVICEVSDPTSATSGQYKVTYSFNGGTTTDASADTTGVLNTIEIENRQGTELPGTGGAGRTMFILVGSTMLAAGLISLVVFRKRIFASK